MKNVPWLCLDSFNCCILVTFTVFDRKLQFIELYCCSLFETNRSIPLSSVDLTCGYMPIKCLTPPAETFLSSLHHRKQVTSLCVHTLFYDYCCCHYCCFKFHQLPPAYFHLHCSEQLEKMDEQVIMSNINNMTEFWWEGVAANALFMFAFMMLYWKPSSLLVYVFICKIFFCTKPNCRSQIKPNPKQRF